MPPKKKIVIIGAGPAGLTAAIKLCEAGNFDVTVIESAGVPGGLSRSLDLWQRKVDLGPHRFFSKRADVKDLWSRMAGNDVAVVKRKTSILFKDRLIDYPLSAGSVLTALSPVELLCAGASYIRALIKKRKPENTFEDVIINRFGNFLYLLFFKSYTEKVWGVECAKLDSSFALQRIRDFDLTAAMVHLLKRVTGKRDSPHETLLSHFAYPQKGAGSVYVNMAAEIEKLGGTIRYDSKVAKLKFEGKLFTSVVLTDGTSISADNCISTMPLTHLLESSFPEERALLQQTREKLKFRNTIIVYLKTAGKSIFEEQWIYINQHQLRLGRVTNFNNWSNTGEDSTVLCLEMWCDSHDLLWGMADSEISALAIRELLNLPLFKNLSVIDSYVMKLANSYPVYMRDYRLVFDSVARFLSGFDNLICIGRAGGFRYNNQDHSILMGLLAFENISFNKKHDIWSVNLNSDYQETGSLNPNDRKQIA